MNTWKYALIVLSCVALNACAGLREMQDTAISGEGFLPQLAKAYQEFAQAEADQYDWADADYFARKGLIAHGGHYPAPEDMRRWEIADEHKPALRDARDRLVSTLTVDIQQQFPTDAARAQMLYDCWVEQQEENWQTEDIATCQKQFEKHMANLDTTILAAQVNDDAPSNIPLPVEPTLEPFEQVYNLLFPLDSTHINQDQKNMLDDVAFVAHGLKNLIIRLTGHTDRMGDEAYNMTLSKKRAMAVEDEFLRRGIATEHMIIEAKGETDPAVPTQDGIKEPKNRRVEIAVEGEKR